MQIFTTLIFIYNRRFQHNCINLEFLFPIKAYLDFLCIPPNLLRASRGVEEKINFGYYFLKLLSHLVCIYKKYALNLHKYGSTEYRPMKT